MTYRSDSDAYEPYYKIKEKQTDIIIDTGLGVKWKKFEANFTDPALLKEAKAKNRTLVAVISHCSAVSKRDKLVNDLKNLMKIDVYGKCKKFR